MRLVECLDCRTENTLNSRFCRSCGGRLPEDEVLVLKAENAKLISDAKMLFGDHRTDECKMMVESVLEIDPSDLDAKALLADCFEREGRLHDAIELYEEITLARPDSAIDRVRFNHLNKLTQTEELAVNPNNNRRNALFTGIAAFVLIACVGSAIVIAANPQSNSKVSDSNLLVSNQGQVEAFRSVIPVPTSVPPTTIPETTNPVTENNSGVLPDLNGVVTPGVVSPTRGTSRRVNSGMSSGESNFQDSGLQPLQPTVPPNITASVTPNSSNNSGKPVNNDPDPASTIDPNAKGQTKKPAENQGIVEIQVLNNQNKNTDSNDSARSAENLIRKARDLYAQGSYSAAVKTYEDALAAGASSGSTNQRIGQCYEKLGNRASAIAAYKRAASSYESSIKRGAGGSRVEAALDACNQAIKNLGG